MYNKQWYDKNKERVAKQRTEKRNVPSISVRCRLCDRNVGVKGLALHLRLHNLTFTEYVDTYFDDFVSLGYDRCHQCKTGIARKYPSQNKIHSFCSSKCGAEWKRVAYTGRECTNKGYKWNDVQRQSHSIRMRGKAGIKHSESTKKKISVAAKAHASKTDYVNPMKGKTHTEESIRKIFSKRSLTSLEILVADTLSNADIQFTPQYFLSRDGECYSYDFHLTGTNILIEADGDYWHGGPGVTQHHKGVETTRLVDLRKTEFANAYGYKVVRVWESEMNIDPVILLERLP